MSSKDNIKKKYHCQECYGTGLIQDDVCGGYPVEYTCGYCKGKGTLTGKNKSRWLNDKKEDGKHGRNG